MGLKLEPNNPMYGGDASAVRAPEEIPTKAPPEVMFDVGVAKKQPTMMDFDLGLATTQVPAAELRQDSTLIMNSPMDFDVLATPLAAPASSEKNTDLSASQLDDLIFDVTGGHAAASAAPKEQTPEAPSAKPSEDLTFTLDIPGADKFETPLPAASKPPMEINFTEISLNLDELPAGSATTGDQDAHWQDVATKLDLATAYREMGDTAGAREILEEVVRDGDDQQRAAAQSLLQQLG